MTKKLAGSIITALPARNDAGETIPDLYQGARLTPNGVGLPTVARLSPKRLPYGEAFEDARNLDA